MEWIVAGGFSLLIGLVGLWTALTHLKSRKELDTWQTTTGKVIERGIFQPSVPSLGAPAFRYSPLIKYAYAVDGKEYVGNSIHPARLQAPPQSSQKWAQKKAESFPDEVVVHYNVANPADAYLIQTSRALLLTVAAVSSFMILFGLLLLLVQLTAHTL